MSSKTFDIEELGQMVHKSVQHLDDSDQMIEFAEDIAFVIVKHFGGSVRSVSDPEYPLVSIEADENVPSNGGIYAGYDTDVSVEEFMEDVEEREE